MKKVVQAKPAKKKAPTAAEKKKAAAAAAAADEDDDDDNDADEDLSAGSKRKVCDLSPFFSGICLKQLLLPAHYLEETRI